MKIIMIGTSYVGLVTGTCFADTGVTVHCVDTDSTKIAHLQRGIIPIYEPGLQEIVVRNIQAKRLHFTTDLSTCIDRADMIFIAVGTPSDSNGRADTRAVLEVAHTIGRTLTGYAIVVVKSTVPVGTTFQVEETIKQELKQRSANITFDVASNPEFLKEGRAISDFTAPDRVVVGAKHEQVKKRMEQLYKPFMITCNRMLFTDIATAEMIKYTANAMLATRISFMNEIANLCEHVKADIDDVRRGIGADPRIGMKFLYAGCGYGGSCFPKDVRALIATAAQYGYNMPLLQAVEEINKDQKAIPFNKLQKHFKGKLNGRKIAIWGLSFKPETDDIREAPSITIIDKLLDAECQIHVYDPAAMDQVRKKYGQQIQFADNMYQAASAAEALIVLTEWQEFRHPNWQQLQAIMQNRVLIDGRNIYDRHLLTQTGFTYYRIG